jgi:hypothetical protein
MSSTGRSRAHCKAQEILSEGAATPMGDVEVLKILNGEFGICKHGDEPHKHLEMTVLSLYIYHSGWGGCD